MRWPALFEAETLFGSALVTGALSTDAARGSDAPFDPRIHRLRRHRGQIDAADALRRLMAGSAIRASHLVGDERVQDPYCLRCQPQVMGAVLDLLRQAAATLATEANGVSDNPLIFAETGEALSGGNFHAEPVAFAADIMALAICEIGSLAERRIAMLVDPALSGLPAFLTPQARAQLRLHDPAGHGGGARRREQAARPSRPASISIPTSANQEDHVSMAAHGARRLLEMADNAGADHRHRAAGRGAGLRLPSRRCARARRSRRCARCSAAHVPHLDDDRHFHPDSAARGRLVGRGAVIDAVGARPPARPRPRARHDPASTTPAPIRAPRGTDVSAKSWLTEAPLRMLMNNLDPEVAEKPGELVVYGGIGRAARDWQSFDRIVAALRELEADETLLVQSGKPVGVFRTHADAPRVLIANSNLVPHWATWEHFNELDRKGLMMFGQMTAGSWIYIGSQGIVQGTYETFVEMGRQHYRRQPRRPLDPDRGAGRHGRRAAAGRDHGRRLAASPSNAGRAASSSGCAPAISTSRRRTSTRRWRSSTRRRRRRSRCRSACSATPPTCCPSCCAAASAGLRHRPDLGARSDQRLPAEGLDLGRMGSQAHAARPTPSPRRPGNRWRSMCAPCSSSTSRACRRSTTATTSARWRWRRAWPTPSAFRASCRPTSARCSAAASGRSAGPRCRAIPRTSTAPTPR